MARLVIYGAGGFGRELLRIARQNYAQVVFADDEPGEPVLGTPVISPAQIAPDDELVVAIGSSGKRRQVVQRFPHVRLGNLFAATSVIGPDVEIGPGAVFADFTLVTASVRIGSNFQCNAYSHVAHDCVVGDFVTFAGQVGVNGNTVIEDEVTIGGGAVLRNGTAERPLRIGRGAVIGMGAVVTKDVPAGATVVGNPARPIERD